MVIVLVALLPRATVIGLGDAVRLNVPNAFTVSVMVVVAVRPSSVPVTVRLNVPTVAVVLAVRDSRLLLTPGFGLNDAVTPLGRPDIERFTNPIPGLMMICVVPMFPCTTLTVFGEPINVRPGVTFREIVVVCVRLPDVPVMVIVLVPTAAVAPTDNVSTLVEVAGFLLNEAVTPLGNPEADSVTPAVNPFCGVMVIVLFPLAS
jgi:hypothetical protein